VSNPPEKSCKSGFSGVRHLNSILTLLNICGTFEKRNTELSKQQNIPQFMSDKNHQNGELVLTDGNEAVVKCKMP